VKGWNIVKIQVQKENMRKSLKSKSERSTSTRLEVRTYMTNMFRIVFTQGTEDIITSNIPTTGKAIIMFMRNAPLRGYPL
jgi:hypothetical protein